MFYKCKIQKSCWEVLEVTNKTKIAAKFKFLQQNFAAIIYLYL